jgi:transcription elongation factor Elf1
MFNSLRWHISKLIEKIRKATQPDDTWECYFCNHVFTSEHPRINAYKDGKAIYQCEECRIRLDMDITPLNTKLDDSGG